MTDAITRPLAALMAGLHPGWDTPGCAAEIHKARHVAPLDQLAHAAIDMAMRSDLRTPALLADDGPWWHTGRTPDARVIPAKCTVVGHEYERQPCRLCPVEQYDPTRAPTLGTITDAQRVINTAGIALVRTTLTDRSA